MHRFLDLFGWLRAFGACASVSTSLPAPVNVLVKRLTSPIMRVSGVARDRFSYVCDGF